MKTEDFKSVKSFVRVHGHDGPFKPCFSHQKSLDMGILTLEDASYTAEYVSPRLDLHWRNHTKQPRLVGMKLQGVLHLHNEMDVVCSARVRLCTVVRRMLAHDPNAFGTRKRHVLALTKKYGHLRCRHLN